VCLSVSVLSDAICLCPCLDSRYLLFSDLLGNPLLAVTIYAYLFYELIYLNFSQFFP
jgi:hypothetical protein